MYPATSRPQIELAVFFILKQCHHTAMIWILFIAALAAPSFAQYIGITFQNYGIGLIARILVHIMLPILVVMFFEKKKILAAFLHPFSASTQQSRKWAVTVGIIFGILGVIFIWGTYLILRSILDMPEILDSLLRDSKIRREVFPWVALAVVAINPFLEEYFWRGFVYGFFSEKVSALWAKRVIFYFSGIFFAVHHVLIVRDWFNWWQMLLSVSFLIAAGLIFNWMYDKSRSMLASWITHTIADAALVTIGLYIFGFLG